MQSFRRKLLPVLLSMSLICGGAGYTPTVLADDPTCNSQTYKDMRKAAQDAAKAEVDQIDSLFDRVKTLSVNRMACLDIFKNMSIGGLFSWLSLSALVDKLVNAFWDMVCNMAMNAIQDATSNLTTAISKNLELPGEMGRVVGPIVTANVGLNGGPNTGVGTGSGYNTLGGTLQTPSPLSAINPFKKGGNGAAGGATPSAPSSPSPAPSFYR